MSSDGKPAYTRVFRTYDGSSVTAPDFRQAYEDRIRLVGRDILVADKDKDATTLRLYDPLTGKDLWKQAFAAKSFVLQAEDGDLAGVVEPDGRVPRRGPDDAEGMLDARQARSTRSSWTRTPRSRCWATPRTCTSSPTPRRRRRRG